MVLDNRLTESQLRERTQHSARSSGEPTATRFGNRSRKTPTSTDTWSAISDRLVRALPIRGSALAFVTPILFVGPAAQSGCQACCGADVARNIQNIFTRIQIGGPLVGGVLALGGTVALTYLRRLD